MRIQPHIVPSVLLHRTLRDHLKQWWRVEGITTEHLIVSRSGGTESGKLRLSTLPSCTLYPRHDELTQRYPRLLGAMRWAAILSPGEALDALQGYITDGGWYLGSEAVAHFGGALACIRQAYRCRHGVRRLRTLATDTELTPCAS